MASLLCARCKAHAHVAVKLEPITAIDSPPVRRMTGRHSQGRGDPLTRARPGGGSAADPPARAARQSPR